MSALLQRYHASNPVGEQKVVTLEISHSAIVTSLGSIIDDAGYLRLAQSFSDLTCAIDTASPPTLATFHASGFGYKLPPRNTNGHQDLSFQIDNVSREAWFVLRAIQAANRTSAELAQLTLRAYLMSDLESVEQESLFTARNFNVTRTTALISGIFHDLVNRRFPRRIYSPAVFPGAKYL